MLLVCNGDDHYPVHSSPVRVLVLHHNFPLQLPSVTKSLAFGVPTILGLLNEMYQMPSIWMCLIQPTGREKMLEKTRVPAFLNCIILIKKISLIKVD